MKDYPPFWEEGIETLSPADLRPLQEERFKRQWRYVLERSPFYREKFERAGIQPERVRGLDDLPRLPFTTKGEIRASQAARPPLGLHIACAPEDLRRIYSSSGTTGRPNYIGITRRDYGRWMEVAARSYYCGGVRPHHRVVSALGAGPFIVGSLLDVFERIGATVIPIGPGNTARIVAAFQNLGARVLSCTPSYARYVANYCREQGIEPGSLGVELVTCGGEPGGGVPSVRREIEEGFGCRVAEFMGLSEIGVALWGECPCKEGMHLSGGDDLFVELVDPDTGEPVEMADGAQGELVYTHLNRECVPLIRYRSGDHATVWSRPCACGRKSIRTRCIGRTDDLLIVRGVNVYPSAVKDVVGSFRPRTTGEMMIVLKSPGPRVDPPLAIEVEHSEGAADLPRLKAEIEAALRDRLVFRAEAKLVPPGTLPRHQFKAQLVRKEYSERPAGLA
ncbi:MAG: AMP-binding protein [Candidatus Tectomicrobia bacterium]|nr:AMP-binding protein [Candidatus Tectomicrobia bacterium]